MTLLVHVEKEYTAAISGKQRKKLLSWRLVNAPRAGTTTEDREDMSVDELLMAS